MWLVPWVPDEPLPDLQVFVRSIVVQRQMNLAALRCVGLDPLEEGQELPVTVPRWQEPITFPVRTLSAANSVVVPCRS